MKILTYTIPEELQTNPFIISLSEQETLSNNQVVALKSMLNIEIDVIPYSTKSVKKYCQYFYRPDYHGDMLQDHSYAYDVPDNRVDSEIQDDHAAQYGAEAYVNEFRYVDDVELPANVENVSQYMIMFFEDYDFLVKKIARNRFRTVKARNNAVNALNSLTSATPNENTISKAIYTPKY